MKNNNLTSLLTAGQNPGNLLLLHATADDFPLADFVIQQLKPKFAQHHKQYFSIDRYFDFSVLEDILNSPSLFTEPNYIQLSFKTKPNVEQQKQLIKLTQQLDGSNSLIILCDKLTKTEQNSTWAQSLNRKGTIIGLSSYDAKPLLQYLFDQYQITITDDALEALVSQNQGNFSQLFSEANKLTLTFKDKPSIGITEITELISDNSQFNIYQLSASYLSGNLLQSIKILNNLYQESGDAILIAWIMQEDVKRLLKIKSKLRTSNNIRQIMQEMRLWGETIDKLPIAEKRLNYKCLLNIYDHIAKLDMAIKGVIRKDIKLLLTDLIMMFCNGKS